MAIDFQGLLDVLHAAENEPNLDMRYWKEHNLCGTTHCMIGAFCYQYPHDRLKLHFVNYEGMLFEAPILEGRTFSSDNIIEYIAERFGITEYEASWIFSSIEEEFAVGWQEAYYFTKEQALARLRKFIYYKLHKQEMTLETARRISGRRSAVLASQA